MKRLLLFLLLILAAWPDAPTHAQTLGQVIQAVDRRHKLLIEKRQMVNGTPLTPINWQGLGTNPAAATVNGLPPRNQILLLRQAYQEISKSEWLDFVDPRKIFDAGGAIVRFEGMDHQDIDLAHFPRKLRELTARLRLMKLVVDWPADTQVQRYSFEQNQLRSIPSEINIYANVFDQEEMILGFSIVAGGSVGSDWAAGHHYDDQSHWDYNVYSFAGNWTVVKSAKVRAPSFCGGKLSLFQWSSYEATALQGTENLIRPTFQLILDPVNLSPGSLEMLSVNFPPSDVSTFNLAFEVTNSGYNEKMWVGRKYPNQDLEGSGRTAVSASWTPYVSDLIHLGLGFYFDENQNFFVRSLFEADFGEEFTTVAAEVIEQGEPIVIHPNLERRRLEITLDREPENECKLVWEFPFRVTYSAIDPDDPESLQTLTGTYTYLSDHSLLNIEGGGKWEAVYSGKAADREKEVKWTSWGQTLGRWKGFRSYIEEWWQPTLVQLACRSYVVDVKQETGDYKINFYRRDQAGATKDADGKYPLTGLPFKTITVMASPSGSQTLQMTSDGVTYDLSVTSTAEEDSHDNLVLRNIHWQYSYSGPAGTGSQDVVVTNEGDLNGDGKAITQTKVNDLPLPKRTVYFTGKEPKPENITRIVEESGAYTQDTAFGLTTDQLYDSTIIIRRTSTTQTGGLNPYTITYDADGLIKSTTRGPRTSEWSYNGSTVTRVDKFNDTVERTLSTLYSKGMARAVTTAVGVAGAATAILESDATNPYRPWGPKIVRGFDGNVTTLAYTKEADQWKTVARTGWYSESPAAGARTETLVNAADKVTSWERFDLESGARLDYATATAYQDGILPKTYERPFGSPESFVYDGQGRVTSHTDRLGRVTGTAYDVLGRVRQITEGAVTWNIAYNPGHLGQKVTCAQDATRTWEETTTPFGGSYTLAITGPQNTTFNRTEDADAITISATNAMTKRNWTETTTKASGRRVLAGTAVRLSGTAAETWTTTYEPGTGKWTTVNSQAAALTRTVVIDPVGCVRQEETPNPADGNPVARTFAYSSGRLASTTGPEGTTAFGYQPDGRLGSVSRDGRTVAVARTGSSSGQITWKWWNGEGEVINERTWYPASGSFVDAPWGQAARRIWTTTSIANGTLTVTTSGPDAGGTRKWNAAGAPTAGSAASGPFAADWTATPNAFGEITSAVERPGATGSGRTWNFSTATGLPTSATGLANLGATDYSATFSAAGNLSVTATRDGKSTTDSVLASGAFAGATGYGRFNQTWGTPSIETDEITRTLTVPGLSGGTLRWNFAGLLRERDFAGGDQETFLYNAAGALVAWFTPAGQSVDYGPNAFGEPTQIGSVASNIAHDRAGRLKSWTDRAGDHARSYVLGQLDVESHVGGALGGQWVNRDYDALGRLKLVGFPGAANTTYAYDAGGRIATVTTPGGLTFTYGNYDAPGGRAKTLTVGALTIGTTFDEAGRVTGRTGAATTSAYGYNAYGLASTSPAGTLGYNGNGFLTTATGSTRAYAWHTSGMPAGGSNHHPGTRGNSAAVRLDITTHPSATVAVGRDGATPAGVTPTAPGVFTVNDTPGAGWHVYDVLGTIAGAGNNGTNAVAEERRAVYVAPPSESLVYEYGHLVSDARWSYAWNELDQLISATETNPLAGTRPRKIEFVYDAFGRRTEKRVSIVPGVGRPVLQSHVSYLHDGWKLAREIQTDGSGAETLRRVYAYGPDVSGTLDGAAGIGGLLEVDETRGGAATTKNIVVDDGRGNVLRLVDAASGAVVASYAYGPFGELLSATGARAGTCPLRYQTKYYDEELGYLNFGRRLYDPRTGTFLSWDPLREAGGSVFNGYCNNQPVGNCDPTGLSARMDLNYGLSFNDDPTPSFIQSQQNQMAFWTQVRTNDLAFKESYLDSSDYRLQEIWRGTREALLRTGLSLILVQPLLETTAEFDLTGSLMSDRMEYGDRLGGATDLALALTPFGFVSREARVSLRASLRGAALDAEASFVAKTTDVFGDYMRTVETLDVSTARNSAVFYSGPGNRALAESFAAANGRLTLEKTVGGSWLDAQKLFNPGSPLTPQQATQVWSRLSQRFAQEASGNSVGFVNGARAEGIFNTVEFPTLLENPNVTNVLTGGH